MRKDRVAPKATVSSRGQITIPGEVRDIAHIHAGDILEFEPHKDSIIVKRLIVKRPGDEKLMSIVEWKEFDRLVKKQLKLGQYTAYSDIGKAKRHSKKLMQ